MISTLERTEVVILIWEIDVFNDLYIIIPFIEYREISFIHNRSNSGSPELKNENEYSRRNKKRFSVHQWQSQELQTI